MKQPFEQILKTISSCYCTVSAPQCLWASLECEPMLLFTNCLPYLCDIFNSFVQKFL